MNGKDDAARVFLTRPVPGGRTREMEEWKRDCFLLGQNAVRVFLDALTYESEDYHYAAVLGLRVFGYSAFAEGELEDRKYVVRSPDGTTDIIVPKHKPCSGPRDSEAENP